MMRSHVLLETHKADTQKFKERDSNVPTADPQRMKLAGNLRR